MNYDKRLVVNFIQFAAWLLGQQPLNFPFVSLHRWAGMWKLEALDERLEANSEAKVLKRIWKRKQFFQNQALTDFQTGYNRWGKM